jgi:hypothetical protein
VAVETNAPPSAAAAETLAAALTPEQMFEGGTNTYNNWVEVSAGGFVTSGKQGGVSATTAEVGQRIWRHRGFALSGQGTNGISLTVDGRAMFDEDDLPAEVGGVEGKARLSAISYNEFQTWYNGDGAISVRRKPTTDCPAMGWRWIGGRFPLKRVCRLDKLPSLTFKYTHATRGRGQGSTIWGPVHPANDAQVRGISPSVLDLDEHRGHL